MNNNVSNHLPQFESRFSTNYGHVAYVVSQRCGCPRVFDHDAVVLVKEGGSDWPNIVIAVVAVGGAFSRWIHGLVVHPDVKFKEAERYNYTMPSSLPNSNSQDTEKEEDLDFYVPIVNEGRAVANGVSVSVDCVLESGGDGDSYNVMYFGMPMQMGWKQEEESLIVIPANDVAYFKFVSFSSGTQSGNTPDADTERYLTCSICSTCTKSNRFLISKASNITVLARVSLRAQNMNKTIIRWVFLHWNSCETLAEISDVNFKIRLAEKNEIKKAEVMYKEYVEKGVQSR